MIITKQKSILDRIKYFFFGENEAEERETVADKGCQSNRKKLYRFLYAHSQGDKDTISKCYSDLYKEYSKIHKINLSKLAKNSSGKKRLSTIEYAERLDKTAGSAHVINLSVIAKRLFGNQATELSLEFQTPKNKGVKNEKR